MSLFGRRTPRSRADAQPPPQDAVALADWMRELFDRGQYREVWEHRLALGLDFSRNGAPDNVWFWLNAYPALAALRANIQWTNPLGQSEWHPLVSTCAAYADDVHGGLGDAEKAANAEIARRFFS